MEALAWGTLTQAHILQWAVVLPLPVNSPTQPKLPIPFLSRPANNRTTHKGSVLKPQNPVVYSSREALMTVATVHWYPIRPGPCLSPANVTAICGLPLLSGLAHHFHRVPKLAEYSVPFVISAYLRANADPSRVLGEGNRSPVLSTPSISQELSHM